MTKSSYVILESCALFLRLWSRYEFCIFLSTLDAFKVAVACVLVYTVPSVLAANMKAGSYTIPAMLILPETAAGDRDRDLERELASRRSGVNFTLIGE